MKFSFKTITLIAAIGMIVYTLYITTRYIIHEYYPMAYNFNLWVDIRTRILFDILPISMIVACVGLYMQRPKEPSKAFRILTIGIFVAMLGTLVFCYQYTVQVCWIKYLYPSIYWRVIMLILGIVWLFMLRKQPTEEASPRSFRVTLIITMLILALPILLEMTSGLSLLTSGNILCLNSSAIKSWVRWLAPILPLIHLVFPSIRQINKTSNSHCTPGSFDERTFKRNRIITLVLVGIAIIALIVCLVCAHYLHDLYFRQYYDESFANAYRIFETATQITELILLAVLPVSWIMLSIMAFRQLPNPRGYKIYNIACQCLSWGNLIAAIVLSIFEEPIAETFAILALISFLAFFITQSIRVISYNIPNADPQQL